MESNNVIYKSEKYSVLAEEIFSFSDVALFELRLILNVLEISIDTMEVWCSNMENLRTTFSIMTDTTVVKKFNERGVIINEINESDVERDI